MHQIFGVLYVEQWHSHSLGSSSFLEGRIITAFHVDAENYGNFAARILSIKLMDAPFFCSYPYTLAENIVDAYQIMLIMQIETYLNILMACITNYTLAYLQTVVSSLRLFNGKTSLSLFIGNVSFLLLQWYTV